MTQKYGGPIFTQDSSLMMLYHNWVLRTSFTLQILNIIGLCDYIRSRHILGIRSATQWRDVNVSGNVYSINAHGDVMVWACSVVEWESYISNDYNPLKIWFFIMWNLKNCHTLTPCHSYEHGKYLELKHARPWIFNQMSYCSLSVKSQQMKRNCLPLWCL